MFTHVMVGQHPSSIIRRAFVFLASALLVALLPLSVAHADEPGPQPLPEAQHVVYESAEATGTRCWGQGNRNICTDMIINVLAQNSELQLCATRTRYQLGPEGTKTFIIPNESGCRKLPKQAFTLDNGLKQATLAPTKLTVKTQRCDATGACTVLTRREIIVAATARSDGNIRKHNNGWTNEQNGCVVTYSDAYRERSSVGTVSFDGKRVEAYGGLAAGETTTTVECP